MLSSYFRGRLLYPQINQFITFAIAMNQRVKDTFLKMNELGKSSKPFLFLIDFSVTNAYCFPLEDLNKEDILVATPAYSNCYAKNVHKDFYFRKHPIEYDRYAKAYTRVLEAINRGDTFLLNLTFPTKLDTNLTIEEFFFASDAKFRIKFRDQFVVFSPEPFITIRGNSISSFPMKGTIDTKIEDAENKLMNDIKEISEHNTIVDLIRNDLSMVAKRVRVEKFRYIEKIKTHERELLQTSSKITGELPADWKSRVGDILFRLLPAGSISGAPKKKTMEVIRESEGYDRGWFTGVFGIYDGENLESAVMIRYIEKADGNLIFKSGGGITHFSNCEQEYRELVEKVGLPTL